VEVVLRIGAAESPLEEVEALWLESTIRRTCFDASGRPWDREAAFALSIADLLDDALARRSSPGPIEVGRPAALGLLNVFHDKDADDVFAHVARSDGVAALYLALRRFVRDTA
jgi:hypothetical protein